MVQVFQDFIYLFLHINILSSRRFTHIQK